MSSKRSLKKQQKRQASALEEAGPGLRQSLARADLARLEELLRSLRRVRPRPSALLVETAEAVLDLAAGRLDAARSRLTALVGAAPDPRDDPKEDLPHGLLASLRGLAVDELAGAEHQPGDAGLLIAGVAGALAGGDQRAFRLLKNQLDRAGQVPAGELAVARRLMAAIAQEEPRVIARILDTLKPSFATGVWPELAALVAREMSSMFAGLLTSVGLKSMGDPELGRLMFDAVRGELSRVRPVLAETAGFAAMELAFDCWRPDKPAVVKRIAKFLAAFPGCEAVLAAFRILEEARTPWSPKGFDLAYAELAQAAIDRLDDRWQLWCPAVPRLAIAVDSESLKLLETKIRQRLAAPETQGEAREALSQALAAVGQVKKIKIGLPLAGRRRAQPRKKKPRRRRGEATQAPLDF